MEQAATQPPAPILKRIVSLLVFVALCGGMFAGYRALPGAGGLKSELRWLLAMPDAPTKRMNQAIVLMATAYQTNPDRALAVYESQFQSAEPAATGQLLYISSFLFGVDSDFTDVFFRWFQDARKQEHAQYAESLARCFAIAIARSEHPLQRFDLLQEGDVAWLAIAVAKEPLAVRLTDLVMLANAGGNWRPSEQIVGAFFSLEGESQRGAPLVEVLSNFYSFFELVDWEAPDRNAVVHALDALRTDNNPLVRLCALRLLAVHGDDAALESLRADGDVVASLLADTDAELPQQ
ncbi:MAG: hypothetical protein AB7N71_03670 [Phycisphaerae bacterium]